MFRREPVALPRTLVRRKVKKEKEKENRSIFLMIFSMHKTLGGIGTKLGEMA
jgi:hypothetical protein